MLSDRLRTVGQSWVRRFAGLGVTGSTNRVVGASSFIVITATAPLIGMLVLGPFVSHGRSEGPPGQLQPSQKSLHGALTIIVGSAIYAEPSEPWPMVVEIDPPQSVPPDAVLHVRGLPPSATLSQGYRVSGDVWAVPLVGLSNLEIHVAPDIPERSDLTLTLLRPDGRLLAKARTALSILKPVGWTPTIAAVKDTSGGDPARREQEAGLRNELIKTLPAATSQTIKLQPAEYDRGQEAAPEAPTGQGLSETKSVSTSALEFSPATTTAIVPEPPLGAAKTMTLAERSRAKQMIVRGELDLNNGNVSGARQFFLRAAEAGLAQGAFLLASTYDSHEFAKLRFVGVQANPTIARKWYSRARELGALQAQERLTRLGVAD